ncbi:hypothetical protein COLO4_20121 [Corchorus olitorius]|uniref:Cyclin-D1-binding protein 1 n=1 Tax=Corchorus olitorius TaxID=93759 RepID=A0A1R3J1K0_9ROSI|nr:hypothetical protein COLO4_20121 [Corchorus olitorius]
MGKAEKEGLNQALTSHLNTIHETFQMFDQTPCSSSEKVTWTQVIQIAEQLSKQATIAGMLWNGEAPEAKQLEDDMTSYFNVLQGFLLLSHGSTVGAGPTLSSSIHEAVKQVVDCSFRLMKESVSLYGSHNKDKKHLMPQFVGALWEACAALKKVPATNVIAIGRAMTQVAVSVKDVLREMKELKPAFSDLSNEASNDTCTEAESSPQDDDDLSEDDLGSDLSPEEMKVAQLAQGVVSETLVTIKELIRTITGWLKLETPGDDTKFVNSLEKTLKLCHVVGAQIDEIGACLYPPQEISTIKLALEKISSSINELQQEVESYQTSSESFVQACHGLRTSLNHMGLELDPNTTTDLANKMQNVAVSN